MLEDALERSLKLAAAMDSRGYGRTGTATPGSRRTTAGLMLAGMLALCTGIYGLLDSTAPGWLGLPVLAVGIVLCTAGLGLGGRRVRRTRYRPDPWRAPEWIVAASGVVAATLMFVNLGYTDADLNPFFRPLEWPTLPLVPVLAILLAALPAVVAPPPPRPVAPRPIRRPEPVEVPTDDVRTEARV